MSQEKKTETKNTVVSFNQQKPKITETEYTNKYTVLEWTNRHNETYKAVQYTQPAPRKEKSLRDYLQQNLDPRLPDNNYYYGIKSKLLPFNTQVSNMKQATQEKINLYNHIKQMDSDYRKHLKEQQIIKQHESSKSNQSGGE